MEEKDAFLFRRGPELPLNQWLSLLLLHNLEMQITTLSYDILNASYVARHSGVESENWKLSWLLRSKQNLTDRNKYRFKKERWAVW